MKKNIVLLLLLSTYYGCSNREHSLKDESKNTNIRIIDSCEYGHCFKGQFLNNRKNGTWIYFDSNKSYVTHTNLFVNDTILLEQIFQDGKIIIEKKYSNNKLIGSIIKNYSLYREYIGLNNSYSYKDTFVDIEKGIDVFRATCADCHRDIENGNALISKYRIQEKYFDSIFDISIKTELTDIPKFPYDTLKHFNMQFLDSSEIESLKLFLKSKKSIHVYVN